MSLFNELKRRNVFRVGIAYVITAWLVAQVLELVFDSFGAPDWAMKAVLALLAAGLPLVLIFGWIFELTPDGLKRDAGEARSDFAAAQTGRKLDRAIIVVLVLALGYFVWESRFAAETESGTPETTTAAVNPAADEPAPTPRTNETRTVAVLPFINMSPDPEKEYFSDGITEEVINALVKIPGLSVPARTSVFAYKGRLEDVRRIGRELDVDHVLEGSIRSQGKQVRITAQLINVQSGYHLWSETFDRQLENIFAVQEEIAGAIAEVLVGELGVKVAAVPNQTRDMEAYDLYLQGRAALRNRDRSAITLFQAVTGKDPGFAPGWAALAMAHNSIDDDDELAIEAADKALSMDPDNVDALNAKGAALRGLTRWMEAERYFQKALAIDPNSAELLEDYAEFLNFVGRTDEALEVTTRAMAIEPGLRPLRQEHLSALLASGRVAEARSLAEAENEPDNLMRWLVFMPVWLTPTDPGAPVRIPPRPASAKAGELDPATRELLALMEPEALAAPSRAWANDLRTLLDREIEANADLRLFWYALTPLIRAGQLDYVMALHLRGNPGIGRFSHEWAWTPPLAPLRQHPGYAELLKRTGLIDYWDATAWPEWCRRTDNGAIACH